MAPPIILVTGFEPYGTYPANPSEELARAVDGRTAGDFAVRSAVLPVHHERATARMEALLADLAPSAVVHLGLAGGRARVSLERVAVNVMDFSIPDCEGFQASGQPCVPGGPAAYLSSLPLRVILDALTAEGIPAHISSTAGTFLCNQTLYSTLHAIERGGWRTRAGFIHVPLSPSMVARSGLEEPSMAFPLMLRALEVALDALAGPTGLAGGEGFATIEA